MKQYSPHFFSVEMWQQKDVMNKLLVLYQGTSIQQGPGVSIHFGLTTAKLMTNLIVNILIKIRSVVDLSMKFWKNLIVSSFTTSDIRQVITSIF